MTVLLYAKEMLIEKFGESAKKIYVIDLAWS